MISGIVISLSNLLFGFLFDRSNFKFLMYIITFFEIFISASFYFFAKNDYIIILYIILILICIGGTFSVLAPEFNRIFGIYHGAEIFGITGIWIGIANLIGPLLAKYILENNTDYAIAFLIGGSLCVIKLGILIFFIEERYINTKYVYKTGRETVLTEDSF